MRFLVLLGFNAILLVLWLLLDPPTPTTVYRKHAGIGLIDHQLCMTEGTIFQTIEFLNVVGCILYTTYLSYKTRNLSKNFNEAKTITVSMFVLIFCGIIIVPLMYAL